MPGSELVELFAQFFDWQREVEQALAEDDRMFSVKASNGRIAWVIEDEQAITVLYPEEY